jgi:carbonic anhydrase
MRISINKNREGDKKMKTQTKLTQDNLSPEKALELLIAGNQRFIENMKVNRDLHEQILATRHGQYPFAVVLSCIDSRVPAELVFDQGIGDIFSVRIAGNIVNEDILGSIEYGCKFAGSKIVVVMGHTKCGAVAAACQGVKHDNISQLLEKISPAIQSVNAETPTQDETIIHNVTLENIKVSIQRIRQESQTIAQLEAEGTIKIVGALYDISNGQVTFLNTESTSNNALKEIAIPLLQVR